MDTSYSTENVDPNSSFSSFAWPQIISTSTVKSEDHQKLEPFEKDQEEFLSVSSSESPKEEENNCSLIEDDLISPCSSSIPPVTVSKNLFPCFTCQCSFPSVYARKKHDREVHIKKKVNVCPFCLKNYQRLDHLNDHMGKHIGLEPFKPFKCLQCKRGFRFEKNLTSHMRIHTNSQPFTCPICFKRYAYKQTMKQHAIKLHGMSNDQFEINPSRKIIGTTPKTEPSVRPSKKVFKKKEVPKGAKHTICVSKFCIDALGNLQSVIPEKSSRNENNQEVPDSTNNTDAKKEFLQSLELRPIEEGKKADEHLTQFFAVEIKVNQFGIMESYMRTYSGYTS